MFLKIAGQSLSIMALLYSAIFCLLWWGQNKLIFQPSAKLQSTPAEFQLDFEEVWLQIGAEKIHGWWIPSTDVAAPTLLYFHGNASNNGDLGEVATIFSQLGLAVLLVDYRGYGKSSPNFPTEEKAYEDAISAWDYLTLERGISPEQIFVYGHSLGGAIAIELAIRRPQMAGLITEGTFTSIVAMAGLNPALKIFPLNLMVHQRFDSINKISSLTVPWLILHGTEDETVPVFMAQKLYAAAPEFSQLEIVPQAQHNNLPMVGGLNYQATLQQFIGF